MKLQQILLTVFAFFFINEMKAEGASFNIDSLLLKGPSAALHRRIDYRQDSLVKNFPSNVSEQFQAQVNSIQLYIELKNITLDKKIKYLTYLASYLGNIEKPNAINYFNSGRYLSCLQFYPAIIDYAAQGRLSELLSQNKLLALKSIHLYRNEKEAQTFLEEYVYENPDEVIRNMDEFAETNYANNILLKISAFAPLSAERYLGGFNTVNRIIKTSDDPIAKAIVKIDSIRTNRHVNFIFLNEVLEHQALPDYIANITNNKIAFFKELSKIHFNPSGVGKYSADRELSLISSDIIREINYYYSNGYEKNVSSILSSFNGEEMYLIFMYGYQNANTFSFEAYLKLMKLKTQELFTKKFYESIGKSDLEKFIKTAEQFKKTQEIIALTDSNYRDQLLSNLSNNEEVKMDFSSYMADFNRNLTQLNIRTITNVTSNARVINSENNIIEIKSSNISGIQTDSKEAKLSYIDNKSTNVVQSAGLQSRDASLLGDKNIEIKSIDGSIADAKLHITNQNNALISKDEIINYGKSDVKLLATNSDIVKEINYIPVPIVIKIRQDEKYTYEILKNIDNTLGNINYTSSFLDKNYSRKVLNTIATMHPDDIFRQVKNLQSKYWIKEVLEVATKQSPLSYKRYLPNDNHPVRYILSNSTDSTILKLNSLYKEFGYKSNLYNFIDDIVSNKKTAECVDSLCKNNKTAFKEMISIITQKNCIGKYSLERELENNALLTVRSINDLVNVSDEHKLNNIRDYTAEEIYVLMIYGEDELFKSSFNLIYDLFITKIGSKNSYAFLEGIDFLHFRTFLKILANFNKTENFLTKMSADQRLALISKLVKNLDQEKYNPSEVIYVAEAIPGFTLMNDRAVINTFIKKEFERLQADNSGTGMLMYGLLASIIEKDAVAEVAWYKEIKASFQLPSLDRISINSLKVNNVVVQQHFFYNDDDGKSSYANFISTFKSMPNWEILPRETYVQINSTSGNKVIILANKPEYEQNGINDIQKFITSNQYVVTVVVHRGHSFHTEKTLSVIPATTKLLIVGSCGGYYKLPIAIERAPNAQIVSTKQIGTMRVNDPIIKTACEDIRLGKDIIWSDFWSIIENMTGKTAMFYDYVPPNKNLGSLFLNAYYSAIEKSALSE